MVLRELHTNKQLCMIIIQGPTADEPSKCGFYKGQKIQNARQCQGLSALVMVEERETLFSDSALRRDGDTHINKKVDSFLLVF